MDTQEEFQDYIKLRQTRNQRNGRMEYMMIPSYVMIAMAK